MSWRDMNVLRNYIVTHSTAAALYPGAKISKAAHAVAVLAFTTRHGGGDKAFTTELLQLIGCHLPEDSRHCQTAHELTQYFDGDTVDKPMFERHYCDLCWRSLDDGATKCTCSGEEHSASCMLFADLGLELQRRFAGRMPLSP